MAGTPFMGDSRRLLPANAKTGRPVETRRPSNGGLRAVREGESPWTVEIARSRARVPTPFAGCPALLGSRGSIRLSVGTSGGYRVGGGGPRRTGGRARTALTLGIRIRVRESAIGRCADAEGPIPEGSHLPLSGQRYSRMARGHASPRSERTLLPWKFTPLSLSSLRPVWVCRSSDSFTRFDNATSPTIFDLDQPPGRRAAQSGSRAPDSRRSPSLDDLLCISA
jgi:hypothetical protein